MKSPRNQLFRGRVTVAEKKAIMDYAAKLGLSVTDLVLKLIKYKKPKSN